MQDGDHVQDLLHEGQVAEQHQQGVQLHAVGVYQVTASGRQLCPISSCANVGSLSVFCECCPPEDPDCHVNHHLQQDFGKSQQYVEICTIVPHYTGIIRNNCYLIHFLL